MEVGVAIERKGLMIRNGICDKIKVLWVDIGTIGRAVSLWETRNESSLIEVLMNTGKLSEITFPAISCIFHLFLVMAVKHRVKVLRSRVPQSMEFVKLIGLWSNLRKWWLCGLNGGIALVLGLLLEPSNKFWKLQMRLISAHWVQEDEKHILGERRRGRGLILAAGFCLFFGESAVVKDVDVVPLLHSVEDNVVLICLLGLLQSLVSLCLFKSKVHYMRVSPFVIWHIFKVRKPHDWPIL